MQIALDKPWTSQAAARRSPARAGRSRRASRNATLLLIVPLALGVFAVPKVGAVPITPGNLLVYRVDGNGAALGTDAAIVRIDEYTLSGLLVQTITFPYSGQGPLLTGSGTEISEGKLTVSPNGRWVAVAGYNAPENTASVVNASGISRTIGRIDTTDGSIDVSTSGPLVTGFNPARSAIFDDTGTNIWTALHGSGANFGLTYLTLGRTTAGTQLLDPPRNVRGVRIFDGQLYQYADHPANQGVYQVGTGLPTTGPQTLYGLPGISGAGGVYQGIYGFFMADLDDNIPGYDTLWMARDNIGVTKFSLVGGIWTPINTNIAGVGTRVLHLDGWVNEDRSVTLAVVSGAGPQNSVMLLTDSSGYNQPLAGTFTNLVSAPPFNRFGGVVFVPEPNPAIFMVWGAVLLLALRRRR